MNWWRRGKNLEYQEKTPKHELQKMTHTKAPTKTQTHTLALVAGVCNDMLKIAPRAIIIIIMNVFLERLSMWNMLSCAEQVQIQKYKTYAYKTLKTAGVQIIMLKHPTNHKKDR